MDTTPVVPSVVHTTPGSSRQPSVFSGKLYDDDFVANAPIKWTNIIFLPFNPVFRAVILCVVITKSLMGPLKSVFSTLVCELVTEGVYFYIQNFYIYFCDPIYGAETFLFILHRQVTDEAQKQDYVPKSAIALILDVLALIPLHKMMVGIECVKPNIWPNIVAYNEVVLIYRVVMHFNIFLSNSLFDLLVGIITVLIILINAISCLHCLATYSGLCEACTVNYYDWRVYILWKSEELHSYLSSYYYSVSYCLNYIFNCSIDELRPNTSLEFLITCIMMATGFFVQILIFYPKVFADGVIRMLDVFMFHSKASVIIEKTKRRNAPAAYTTVVQFYSLLWRKRMGLTHDTRIFKELPRYLRVWINLDIQWVVFYHSPTLRRTSDSYKRWLCEHIYMRVKLPGQRFYTGSNCFTNLYYLRSGIVQIVSADDSVSPLITVTSDTLFGDISFLVPPMNRTVIVRCLTYCEIFIVSRRSILQSLHLFPEDRSLIIRLTHERLEHARSLYDCKASVRGIDRPVDEGIAWVKYRWWEISRTISRWKKTKLDDNRCKLPPEETTYHCAKYLGQLVLCSDYQLKSNAVFAKTNFPWTLATHSDFQRTWRNVIKFTSYLVLVGYPPTLLTGVENRLYDIILLIINAIYILDVIFILITTTDKREDVVKSFSSVVFRSIKKPHFFVDLFSTSIAGHLFNIGHIPFIRSLSKLNILLKSYVLFRRDPNWKMHKHPFLQMLHRNLLMQFICLYVCCYALYHVNKMALHIDLKYIFGRTLCPNWNACENLKENVLTSMLHFIITLHDSFKSAKASNHLIMGIVLTFARLIVSTIGMCYFMASIYLYFCDRLNYQHFSTSILKHFEECKMHPELMKRLTRYMVCQWRHNFGLDLLKPHACRKEPYDIYWKYHGEVSENIMKNSKLFQGVDNQCIRELAVRSIFLIVPETTVICMFGVTSTNLVWLVRGKLKRAYHNEAGDRVEELCTDTEMLALNSILFKQPSLNTYRAATDCEMLYIKANDFNTIMRRYPLELNHINACVTELKPYFEKLHLKELIKYRKYQAKLKTAAKSRQSEKLQETENLSDDAVRHSLYSYPPILYDIEGKFFQNWIRFKAILVVFANICLALQVGPLIIENNIAYLLKIFINTAGFIDVSFKIFLPYYDNNGILIKDHWKCMKRYLFRTFINDAISCFPVSDFLKWLYASKKQSKDMSVLIMSLATIFLQFYIVTGFFNYKANHPLSNYTLLMIIKWQITMISLCFVCAGIYTLRCLQIDFEVSGLNKTLTSVEYTDTCWMIIHTEPDETSLGVVNHIFAESLNMAHSSLSHMTEYFFDVRIQNLLIAYISLLLGFVNKLVTYYCITLLILYFRGDSKYKRGIQNLAAYLKSERLDKVLLNKALSHLNYKYKRTKGLDLNSVLDQRIGILFKQDINHYFYKKTIEAMDILLNGGENFQRQMCTAVRTSFYQANELVMREMYLENSIFIVHRGKVAITQQGKTLAVLTKGAIFGQLVDRNTRPIRVTAHTITKTDLLIINQKQFLDIVNDRVLQAIAQNEQAKYDYMNLKVPIPWGSKPILFEGTGPWNIRYRYWLYFIWMILVPSSAIVAISLFTFYHNLGFRVIASLLVFDLIYLVHFVIEFCRVEIIVDNNKCVYKRISWKHLTMWAFYMDLISLIIPLGTFVFDFRWLILFRLCRLHVLFEHYSKFCVNTQTRATSLLLQFTLLILVIHGLTCLWINSACHGVPGGYLDDAFTIEDDVNRTIDYSEWNIAKEGDIGCVRLSVFHKTIQNKTKDLLLIPISWKTDYYVALSLTVSLLTKINKIMVLPLDTYQIYIKIFMGVCLQIVHIWIISICMSFAYDFFQTISSYSFEGHQMTNYLKYTGLTKMLTQILAKYRAKAWKRKTGGTLIPEMIYKEPPCLMQDVFCALYLHHLKSAPVFKLLPEYFLRQIIVRVKRMIIYPGNIIVEEGDIYPCVYFIHEGEVERWYTDKYGDTRMASVLTLNANFGVMSGLFPNVSYKYSYYARTVVDLVFLKYENWEDILDCYPDIKKTINEAAKVIKTQNI